MRGFRLLILTFIFISFGSAIAQDFREGYIITIKGDSISGLVEYPSTKKYNNYCSFKAGKKSPSMEYSPETILAYGVYGDRRYESKTVMIEGVKARNFLQVLVKGELSLYRLDDIFYYEKDSLQELPAVKRSMFYSGSSSYYKSEKKYVGILNIILNECNLRADDTPYKEKDLVDLVQNYNRCLGQEGKVYKQNLPWTKIYIQAFGGISSSKLTMTYIPDIKFNSSIGAYAGIGVDICSPRINERLFLSVEPNYYKILYQGYSEDMGSVIIRNDYVMDISLLKTPLGIRYNFWSEKSTPYLKLGYILSFDLGSTYKHVEERENSR